MIPDLLARFELKGKERSLHGGVGGLIHIKNLPLLFIFFMAKWPFKSEKAAVPLETAA